MASLVQSRFNRSLKPESSRPLHPRWGDVHITMPTPGSWCQIDNNATYSVRHGRRDYRPDYVHDLSGLKQSRRSESHDGRRSKQRLEPSHRQSSLIRSLSAHRLSVRQATQCNASEDDDDEEEDEDLDSLDSQSDRYQHDPIASQLARPSRQKYVTTNRHNDKVSFQYIPTSSRKYPEEVNRPPLSRNQSSGSTASSAAESHGIAGLHSRLRGLSLSSKRFSRSGTAHESEYKGGEYVYINGREDTNRREPRSREAREQNHERTVRSASASAGGRMYSPPLYDKRMTRKNSLASKRMTAIMVPSPEDIWE
ncbi:hypothetical protein ASPZODRAFT_18162 [Penicilliopsis zonata CBS 506.65]|uniref:Uncharacterized protein n=1 Tax=Penicilliopsis zonata CBS 506.65 TaxID=1073090 RepID=A0A1L9SBK3_9EURO|nr:hypothetical protein ASPZODRAFT_18162 [Penicilliopsis zonata CBS 506.65]OJJ44585.1 hypothetical protein ASPZODRAFT_18162 [Penicilliopsis zonata CBS 506.65]